MLHFFLTQIEAGNYITDPLLLLFYNCEHVHRRLGMEDRARERGVTGCPPLEWGASATKHECRSGERLLPTIVVCPGINWVCSVGTMQIYSRVNSISPVRVSGYVQYRSITHRIRSVQTTATVRCPDIYSTGAILDMNSGWISP